MRAHGFLPHAETVGMIRAADLLFLPMHDLPNGNRARLVPCKTYEYLASGRPILAALPDGDARDLLAGEPEVHLCRPADVAAMREILAVELGRPVPAVTVQRTDKFAAYERTALAARLVEVYDAVLAAGTRDAGVPALRALRAA